MAGKLPGKAIDSNTTITVNNISFGSNLTINTTAIAVGNSSVNTTINSSSVSVKSIVANGTIGQDGQLLASNGTTTYWTNPPASTNTDAQYTWTNNHTFNALLTVANTLVIGNSTVNTVVNSTSISGNGSNITSVNASTVGGNTAATLRSYSDTMAATAYSNATSYADTKAATAYSNATSYADTKAATAYSNAIAYSGNAAQAYSNATSYADTKAATAYSNATSYASNADNISSGTLNTARLPATVNVSTAINIGANVNLSTTQLNVGNSTVNTVITSTSISGNGANITSVNASTVGGNTAATLRSYSDTVAATAYSNATSYADTKAATAFTNAAARADSAYTNATSYADTKAATAYSNATSYADTKAATAYSNAIAYSGNAVQAYNNAVAYAASNTYVNNTFLPLAGGTLTGALTINSTANVVANLAANNVTVRGNIQIDGNLTVSGTSVTINATSLAIQDNMIYLNNGSTVTHPDLGFAGNYNDGTYRHAGFFRDATDATWKVFDSYQPEPDASAYIDTSNNTFRIANFTANVITANSFSGNGASVTSVDAATVGGNTAATLRTYSDTVAATAYSNGTSYADTKAATAYSNATSYADTKAATAYSNATSYADTKAATAFTNAASRADSAYSNATSYAATIAGTAYSNATSYAATIAGTAYSNAISYSGNAALAYANATSYASNGSNISSGTISIARLPSDQFFNNMGQAHSTQTDFASISNFGTRFVQGNTNGPGIPSAQQYYGFTLGLGSDYAYSSYGSQLYWPRTPSGGNPYISVRFREGGTWGSWSKIYAGYADAPSGSTFTASGDFRAPLFYDSDNTSYYVDPASTSYVTKLFGGSSSGISTGYNGIFATPQMGAYASNKLIYFYNDGSTIKLDAYNYGTSSAMDITIGGNGGYVYAPASFRSPIFYDSDDTNYYVNPYGTSRFYQITGPVTYGSYGSISITGTTNTYAGISFPDKSSALMIGDGSGTPSGFYFGNATWGMYCYSGSGTYGYLWYDLNDTSWYLDPAGVSKLNIIQSRSISQSGGTSITATSNYINYDLINIYGVSGNFTLTPDNGGGTYYNGQKVLIRVAATASISITVGSSGTYPWNQVVTVPTAMANGQTLYVGASFNSTTSKWDIIAARVG